MSFKIIDRGGHIIATAISAKEALAKFHAGRGKFVLQTIMTDDGASISDSELERLGRIEEAEEKRDA